MEIITFGILNALMFGFYAVPTPYRKEGQDVLGYIIAGIFSLIIAGSLMISGLVIYSNGSFFNVMPTIFFVFLPTFYIALALGLFVFPGYLTDEEWGHKRR